MINSRITRQLETIDWDFLTHLPGTSKAIHWYPGTFPSELPGTLIQALSKPNDLVLDPYAGIGTTGLEAIRLGRRAWLVEANPVGALVSYVSASLLILKGVDEALPKILLDSVRLLIIDSIDESGVGVTRLLSDEDAFCEADKILKRFADPSPLKFYREFSKLLPNWGALSKWLHGETLLEFQRIWNKTKSAKIHNFGGLLTITMLSAILRPASSQTQSWGHIADNVWPKMFLTKDVQKLCIQWLSRTDGIIRKTEVAPISSFDTDKRLYVSHYNWGAKRKLAGNRPLVNVMVTSPPYAGAIDYTLAQRLSMYLLGYSEDEIKMFCNSEIGARRKRFMPASRATWAIEIASALTQQLVFTAKSATLGFVLPHKDAGREAGATAIEDCLKGVGFEKILEVDRSIRQGRTRQSWTSIKKEIVQVYGR